LLSEHSRVHQDSNSQGFHSLGSVRVHSLTLSFILGLSFLARNLATPCFGHEPKARVVTLHLLQFKLSFLFHVYYLNLLGILTLSWYKSFGSICSWFPILVGFGFSFQKCSTSPYLTLSSINGHSLIWCLIWWQYVQCGKFGLGTMFTPWILLLQSLRTPQTMLPFNWLNLGSLYFILKATWTPSAYVNSILGKTSIFYLITNTNSTFLDILIP
jgi:hypothetical protein